MSYYQIPEKFEEVVNQQESKKEEILSLTKFFSGYKKIIENFSSQLSKLHSNSRLLKQPENCQDSLSKGLIRLLEFIHSLSESNLTLAKNIQIDVIEPLELFLENFCAVHSEIRDKGQAVSRPLRIGQSKVLKLRADYYMASGEAEKAARLAITEDCKERIEDVEKNEIKMMNKSEYSLAKYLEGLTEVNQLWSEFEVKIPGFMENLQQNEESRIHFTKNTIEKFVRYHQKHETQASISIKSFLETILEINSSSDIQIYVSQYHSPGLKKPEKFVNYDEWKKSLNENEYEIVEKDPDIPSAIEILLNGNLSKLNPNIFNEIKELINISEGRKIFIECLEASKSSNINLENLEVVSRYLTLILDQLIQKNEYNAYLFCKIIEISTKFFSNEGHKKSLSWYLASHSFWKDEKRWIQGVNYAISSKLAVSRDAQKSRMQKSWEDIMGIVTNERMESTSAYILLSQFGYQLSKLNVSLSLGNEIIKSTCEDYGIDRDKQVLLSIELYSRADYTGKKPLKSTKNLADLQYFAYKAGKFLSFQDISEMSCVNKLFYCTLNRVKNNMVYCICKDKLTKQKNLRKHFWLSILNVGQINFDYFTQLNIVNSSNIIGSEIEHIIDMDVARSYHKSNEINGQNLKNILKVFAASHPAIGYCQGMNYIAGTLFLVIQDEDLTYKAMVALIQKLKMTSLFNEQLKKLKKLFFTLDRLISKFLPLLNDTFKDAWIFSDNYSSGWFIALFGNVFMTRFDILVQIWDLSLLQGWKGVFKICLNILKIYQNGLIGESFETILSELSSISLSNIFNETFFTEAAKIPVTSSLLKEIKREYKKLV
jgi:ecotropic viral integration site 5 protein